MKDEDDNLQVRLVQVQVQLMEDLWRWQKFRGGAQISFKSWNRRFQDFAVVSLQVIVPATPTSNYILLRMF